jgi:hypothetical protein
MVAPAVCVFTGVVRILCSSCREARFKIIVFGETSSAQSHR